MVEKHKTKSAITITSILIILFTSLLWQSIVGQVAYVSLISVSILTGFIVFFSDHGENIYEHDIFVDHHGLYDTSMHIPLILSFKNLPKNKTLVND